MQASTSEVLINDSGAVALALRVTFSESVEITTLGGAFSHQEPSGKATEFVFSAGKAELWASVWLSWSPASARIVDVEWLHERPVNLPPSPLGRATVILYNGVIITMEAEGSYTQAIAIADNRILAVGTDQEILALAEPDTPLFDLAGRAVTPGFIDPHTHLLSDTGPENLSFDDRQQLALENGLTSITEMFTAPWQIDEFISYAKAGNMRIRASLYLIHNDSCGTVHDFWYEKYPPFAELAPHLRVGGVKMFAERSLCGDVGVLPVFSSELQRHFPQNPEVDLKGDQLALSREQLTTAIRRAQDKGYSVAIHAIGDVGVETSLRAIADVLGGRSNTLRHMVLHNHFIQDDMLPLYAQHGILAGVEPTTPCWWWAGYEPSVGEDNGRFFKRWRELVATGAHVTVDSDWPNTGRSGFHPMQRLAMVVGEAELDTLREYQPCRPLPVDQRLSVWQGLKMMTTEAAFAMHLDEELGTLTLGKLADLVVLSRNPLDVATSEIKDIQVLFTMVDGKIEYQSAGLVRTQTAIPQQLETGTARAQTALQPSPTYVFYNGAVMTMEDKEPSSCEAIAIAQDRILAIGRNREILALAGPETQLIDLGGRAVLPGFIDPHVHFDAAGSRLGSLDSAQQFALENGITSVGDRHTNEWQVDEYIQYARSRALRLRLSLYPIYNDSCGTVHGFWYEKYPPFAELAPHLRLGGVKIFEERSVCGNEWDLPVFSPALQARFTAVGIERYGKDTLRFSTQELQKVIQRAQDKGYQVAIHAIGDLAIETSLDAIASVLQGAQNPYRHTVIHDYFLREDLLNRFAQSGIVALVEPSSPCFPKFYATYVGEENVKILKRWRDLVETGAHVAVGSDWPSLGVSSVRAMLHLCGLVTGEYPLEVYDELGFTPCGAPVSVQTVTVWQALKMMTTEAAYAMHCEDELGSLHSGKLADLVILSADPMAVKPEELDQIQVLLTMVGGKIEYDRIGLAPQVEVSSAVDRSRVLFDEHHGERNTLSSERAKLINPEHPEWHLFQALLTQLEQEYSVEQCNQPLAKPLLESVDVLILAASESPFADDELESISEFVESGGGLLLLGDAFPPQPLDAVADVFGVHFLPGVIASHAGDWDAQSYWASDLDAGHQISKGAQRFHTNWGCALELADHGVELVRSGQDTWCDEDNDGQQDPLEQSGPFVLAVAQEFGKGRVVAISDNAFHDGMLQFPGNRSLIVNSIEWLCQ